MAKPDPVVVSPGLRPEDESLYNLGLMRRGLFLVWILALLFLACKRRPEYTTGEAVFRGECVKCHKMNGQGGTKGPELTSVFDKKDEDYIRTYVMDPRSIKGDGIMPPAKISEQELTLVVEYLKKKGSSH